MDSIPSSDNYEFDLEELMIGSTSAEPSDLLLTLPLTPSDNLMTPSPLVTTTSAALETPSLWGLPNLYAPDQYDLIASALTGNYFDLWSPAEQWRTSLLASVGLSPSMGFPNTPLLFPQLCMTPSGPATPVVSGSNTLAPAAASITPTTVKTVIAQKEGETSSCTPPVAPPIDEDATSKSIRSRRKPLKNRTRSYPRDVSPASSISSVSSSPSSSASPSPSTETGPSHDGSAGGRGYLPTAPFSATPSIVNGEGARRMMCSNCETTSTPFWRRSSNDELLCNACGLYLKLHGRQRPLALAKNSVQKPNPNAPITQCSNCHTLHTPLWRRDDRRNALCNACGLFYKLHGKPRPIGTQPSVVIRKRCRSSGRRSSEEDEEDDSDGEWTSPSASQKRVKS
ncbi:hypothetical protein SeMB42_g02802 [Synchytrium endobioticum]|uniref:GATA-type domain-containing protein n=1 Tax=Synchytrium endobioticum TaxID=286115 RepID=A0A507DDK5_9FUNG|nr:hypothetical protein SeLEV6574_g04692 [Synchytrium endobioticum]TPX48948.1 hypothetical protein SeMB42_g02802 [Synchytrium endobioticum]